MAAIPKLPTVACPACTQFFILRWKDYDGYIDQQQTPITLHAYHCQSGGIYSVEIVCPYCKTVVDL